MAVPVIANVAPADASPVSAAQLVSFEVTSSPSLQRVMVFARFPGAQIEEVVWDGSAFTERYAGTSSRTAITGGFRFQFRRGPTWPDGIVVSVYAVNTSAEETESAWSYVLPAAATYDPTTQPFPTFPVGSPVAGADSGFPSHDQDYFLRVAGKVLDPDYVAGLRSSEGYEVLQAQAKIFERVSQAVHETANGMLAAYARGGSLAEGTVEFYRTSYALGAGTVKRGTIVEAKGGRYFRTLEDAVFGASDLGPHAVAIRAVFQGYEHNLTGQTITSGGVTIPGEIDKIRSLVEEPAYFDPNIRVRQVLPTTGGRFPALDLLAREKDLSRDSAEEDGHLSFRLRNLPDNITPAAIERALQVLLAPYGATFELVEAWDTSFQTAYDMPEGLPNSNVFVPDDPRPYCLPAINWVSDRYEFWGTFYVNISAMQPIRDFGGCADEPANTANELISPVTGGRRAISAYDLPDSSLLGNGEHLCFCADGPDAGRNALLNGIWDMLRKIRAAGVICGLQQRRN